MRVRTVGQPFREALSLHDFFREVCAEPDLTRLRISVAWAKRSGLVRIESALRDFKSHGGTVMAIVGISEGGATQQGLELIRELSDEAFVFHDPRRTFHPKLYLAEGESRAEVFVGSNNLTAGGVYWNYEFGVWLSLNLQEEQDRSLHEEILAWFESLVVDEDSCAALDEQLLSAILLSDLYEVGDEDAKAARGSIKETQPAASGSPEGTSNLFRESRRGKRPDPLARTASARERSASRDEGTPIPDLESDGVVVRRWFKKLSFSDAQQMKTANSNPTNHLKLGQARHPIDQKVYFRHVYFADRHWASSMKARGTMEESLVPFHVHINGRFDSIQEMKVDYAEFRVADQNNTPTWLHWNEYMGRYLRENNHVGDYITLEVTDTGIHRLILSMEPFGEFLDDVQTS